MSILSVELVQVLLEFEPKSTFKHDFNFTIAWEACLSRPSRYVAVQESVLLCLLIVFVDVVLDVSKCCENLSLCYTPELLYFDIWFAADSCSLEKLFIGTDIPAGQLE